jgi:hypothetical protein
MVTADVSISRPHARPAAPSPLQPSDHYVLKKVCNQLLPWLVASPRIKRQWFVGLSVGYGYLGDLGAALAGLGIGAPLIGVAQHGVKAGSQLTDVLGNGPWTWLGLIGLIAWAVVRLVVQREEVNQRATAARAFVAAMKSLSLELHMALFDADPMPKIVSIQQRIDAKIREANDAGVWPFSPLPKDDEQARLLAERVAAIRATQMAGWTPAPAQERI